MLTLLFPHPLHPHKKEKKKALWTQLGTKYQPALTAGIKGREHQEKSGNKISVIAENPKHET